MPVITNNETDKTHKHFRIYKQLQFVHSKQHKINQSINNSLLEQAI